MVGTGTGDAGDEASRPASSAVEVSGADNTGS